MNKSNFKHVTVRCKILGTMRRSATKGYAQYITNRNGEPWLRVKRVSPKGYYIGRLFEFRDSNGKDVTETVYRSLQEG